MNLREFLEEYNIVHDFIKLEEGLGLFVKAEFRHEVADFLKENDTCCDYTYRCNYEWVVFIL